MHRILDDTECFAEDKCKIYRGNAPEILSMIRKLSINVLATLDDFIEKESVRTIIKVFYQCLPYLETVLTKKPKDVDSAKECRKKMGEGRYANIVPA
jgi:hypothetical protein